VADAVLFRPLPVERAQHLIDAARVSLPLYRDLTAEADTFAGLALYWSHSTVQLAGAGAPARLPAAIVSGNYFDLLGVRPALGRLLAPDDGAHEPLV